VAECATAETAGDAQVREWALRIPGLITHREARFVADLQIPIAEYLLVRWDARDRACAQILLVRVGAPE